MSLRELKRQVRAIRAEEKGIQPDAAWVLRTRETLLKRVAMSSATRPSRSWTQRIALFVRSFVTPQLTSFVFRGPVMAFASLAGLMVGGSFTGVALAERANPGDFFYPMKLAVEQTRLVFTKDKADRLKLKTEYVTRRVKEIKNLATNEPNQPGRIKEAAELLKRDLDTVKTQLHEVQAESSLSQAATVAKAVDKASTEVAMELKNVKENVPIDVKITVTEAQAAAVNTGVKAVQILIDTHDKPESKDVVTNEELTRSLQGKVDGLQTNLQDVTQKFLAVTASSTNLSASTSTLAANGLVASSSLSQIKTAQTSLDETKQLIQDNKLTEVTAKLTESAKVLGVMETAADKLELSISASSTEAIPTATSTQSLPVPTSTTSEKK